MPSWETARARCCGGAASVGAALRAPVAAQHRVAALRRGLAGLHLRPVAGLVAQVAVDAEQHLVRRVAQAPAGPRHERRALLVVRRVVVRVERLRDAPRGALADQDGRAAGGEADGRDAAEEAREVAEAELLARRLGHGSYGASQINELAQLLTMATAMACQ